MAMTTETKRNLDTLGITHTGLEPGGFYQGLLPGGFTCVSTHIHIPGPKVEFKDEFSREIKAFKEIPEPVQIPHSRFINEKNDDGVYIEKLVDFNTTYKPVHEALMYAVQTGVIRYVPDDEMAEKYPDTYADRQTKLIWREKSSKPAKSSRQLLDEAEQENQYARNVNKISEHVKATAAAILEGKQPPKPIFQK